MARHLKIYIAGPYTAVSEATRIQNVNHAIDAAIELLQRGHIPYVPHLTHFVDERATKRGITLTWEDYIAWDLEWLKDCDALLYLGDSRGAKIEKDRAAALQKMIFYSLDSVPPAN